MENGGYSLFEFCVKGHEMINCGKLDISEWHKLVKIIFKQMIECIGYLHKKGVCHNDISLENFLINDVEAIWNDKGKIEFCKDNVIIKLCDFGLAEYFKNCGDHKTDFMSTKYDFIVYFTILSIN